MTPTRRTLVTALGLLAALPSLRAQAWPGRQPAMARCVYSVITSP